MSREPHELLDDLLAALLSERTLNVHERTRLNDLLREDPGALDRAIEQLEVDSLLRWHHGAATQAAAPPPRLARNVVLAAALLVAVGALAWSMGLFDRSAPESIGIAKSWSVRPTGDARPAVAAPDRIQLDSGELLVESREPGDTLTITTPSGTVTSSDGAFWIGTHQAKEKEPMEPRMTRVMVLRGSVVLATTLGALTASAGQLVAAPQGSQPVEVVANAGANFGFDLYRQLVAERGQAAPLCLSPYSIACALSMAAEGARGRTAAEMADALRIPASARRTGGDAQRIPFEWSLVHTGFRDLQQIFDRERRERSLAEDRRIVAGLREEIADLTAREAAAESGDVRRKLRSAKRHAESSIETITARMKTYRLEIANALWGERSHPFRPQFVETVAAAYGTGALVAADFLGDAEGERGRINTWVRERTDELIPELLAPGDVDELTRLVLLNAIYFAGEWVTSFDPTQTLELPFRRAGETPIPVEMMRHSAIETARYAAFERDGKPFDSPAQIEPGADQAFYPGPGGFELLELPYRGQDLVMTLLLPRDPNGLPALERELTADNLANWLTRLRARELDVGIPKFKIRASFELGAALQALGMRTAFQPSADFTGISDVTNPEDHLYITKVVHQATIEVDERGSEAAAATAVIMRPRGSIKPRFKPQILADRPFVYMIRDVRSGTVLFLGRMTGN